jgi:hypothetical protein
MNTETSKTETLKSNRDPCVSIRNFADNEKKKKSYLCSVE